MRRILQISKYDPKHLNAEGNFSDLDEWTDISEVGKIFDNEKFQLVDYLSIEKQYILCINQIFSFFSDEQFKIADLEKHEESHSYDDISIDYSSIVESKMIDRKWLDDIIKLNLRGVIYCKIKLDFNNFIVFDAEMYIYIVTNIPSIDEKFATKFELFSNDQTKFRSEDDWFW